jgi:Protein of unknown function (DUF3263)
MDTVDVDDLDCAVDLADDEVDSDARVRPDVEDRELVVDDGLSERERQVLAFERQWWKHAGSKEQAIRDLFGVSATRYYQLLNALLDNPAALAHDPALVKRLRRLRATRQRARTGGRS